jgi:XTP/dITP diphosphohydrolase
MRKVWFMTGNRGKVAEAKHALQPLGFDVVQLQVEGVEISEPQADNLEEVARSKIEQAIPYLPSPDDALLVEDAGLFVDALHGFPGVYSAYALKTIGFNGLLNLLQDTTQRTGSFHAVAALWLDGKIHLSRGICQGEIAIQASGNDGFGFDPVFIPHPIQYNGITYSTDGKTFADVDLTVKEKFSHRRKALDGLIQILNESKPASSS